MHYVAYTEGTRLPFLLFLRWPVSLISLLFLIVMVVVSPSPGQTPPVPAPAARRTTNPHQQRIDTAAKKTVSPAAIGLLTDWIGAKDFSRWQAMERLVFAKDAQQTPLHPTVHNLWQWVETSGHAVYVEIVKTQGQVSSNAGSFRLLHFDPTGKRHVGVIQLNFGNIELAYVGRDTWRPAGFIPFQHLSRDERYVEVLGHELAHCADILTTLPRTASVREHVEETNELLLHHHSLTPTEQISAELRNRLAHRDDLLRRLEAVADRMEAAVWRELRASQGQRQRVLAKVTPPR